MLNRRCARRSNRTTETRWPNGEQIVMTRRQLRFASLIVSIFLCALATRALGQPKSEPTVATLRQKVIDAKDREEADKAWKALLQRVGPAGLPELMKDKDTSIAVQAAWEAHKK